MKKSKLNAAKATSSSKNHAPSRRDFLLSTLGLGLGSYAGALPFSESAKAMGSSGDKNSDPSGAAMSPAAYKFSSPLSELAAECECIVVGSGYGASVIAARLAKKYSSLCILERGKEWHPGSFPELPSDLLGTFKSKAQPLGLIDIESGSDIDIVCANGLGGTSLINAAISIRPEMNLFNLSVWPKEIQEAAQSGELEIFYKKAESVLKPMPTQALRFAKSQNHKGDTESQRREFGELNLNIRPDSFGSPKLNEFGYPQAGCVHCGNCCSGCNFGAKNTLLTNYLSMARQQGAKIFTEIEVESIEKWQGKYKVHVKEVSSNPLLRTKRRVIVAKNLFLGAGAKGSTQILMRSESQGFEFSKRLGTKLSANGDVMGLAYNTNNKTNILGRAKDKLKTGISRPGAIISTYANFRNPSLDNDIESQFLLLDGVVPSALAPSVAKALASYALLNQGRIYAHLTESERGLKIAQLEKDILSLDTAEDGALNHSMLYFACGHDSSGGSFVFDRSSNSFDFVWKNVLKEKTFLRIQNVMRDFANRNGGTFIENPRSTVFGQKIQATHPLGGCPMGSSVEEGVVNHLGQVFDSKGSLHENLYVVDAAIIPHSLSATPLLTITAFAERIAEKVAENILEKAANGIVKN